MAADGANSKVRDLVNIATEQWDYKQTAIVANVTLNQDHHFTAYERFTPDGPVALLPLAGHKAALIYTTPNQRRDELLALSDQDFLQEVQQKFGYRLGRLQAISKRFAFPLKLTKAVTQIQPGLVLLGNSAHSLHPIAAQGFNLSLRDAAMLAQLFAEALQQQQPLNDFSLLKDYYRWREQDQKRMLALTDGIHRIFHFNLAPFSWLRDAGLIALEHAPTLKNVFAKHSMGLAGKLPNLSCGLPLVEA